MGGRTRKTGCTSHVPICVAFGEQNPFNKIQAQRNNPNSMTQDHTSLRKGMSSHTSYAHVARAVEAKHRNDDDAQRRAAALGIDDTPRGAAAPKLHEDLFGCSPSRPRFVSGFSGHRPHEAFVVGQSVNVAPHEEWRAHAAERECEQHKRNVHYRHLTDAERAEVRAQAASGSARAQGGMVISMPNRATAAKRVT